MAEWAAAQASAHPASAPFFISKVDADGDGTTLNAAVDAFEKARWAEHRFFYDQNAVCLCSHQINTRLLRPDVATLFYTLPADGSKVKLSTHSPSNRFSVLF